MPQVQEFLFRHCAFYVAFVFCTIISLTALDYFGLLGSSEQEVHVTTTSTQVPPTSESSSGDLIVIDTDSTIQDAMALLMALGDKYKIVVGITCIHGITNVSNVIDNVEKLLVLAGKEEVPVYGYYKVDIDESLPYEHLFGVNGMVELPLPSPSPHTEKENAGAFLARIPKENPGRVTVVALGPLTNLALAIQLNPDFLKQVNRVVIPGGTIKKGFVNTASELNSFKDREAAFTVVHHALASGAMLTIVFTDAAIEYELDKEWRWKSLANINNSVVHILNDLERTHKELNPHDLYPPSKVSAMAVALSTDTIIKSRKVFGFVEINKEKPNGSLAVDYLNVTGRAANLELVLQLDTALIKKIINDNLSNFT